MSVLVGHFNKIVDTRVYVVLGGQTPDARVSLAR